MHGFSLLIIHVGSFAILEAADGQQGFVTAAREPLALVIMNLGLPVLAGWLSSRRIRALPSPTRTIPILAFTAYAMPEYERQARGAGCDDYLTKPLVDITVLRQMIMHLLAKRRTP